MTLSEILDYVWLGNPVSRWLVALGLSLVVLVALWPIKRYILSKLRIWVTTTDTELDNMVVKVLGQTKRLFIVLFAILWLLLFFTQLASCAWRPLRVIHTDRCAR